MNKTDPDEKSKRFICFHGHFYQPPRENPWLEEIEVQDEVYPYHDWNERINAECYSQNCAARVLDAKGRIERIVNNYSRISFNFGPTLLSWLERKDPETYHGILRADAESRERFNGHGSAIAQAYNHMIMPLASARDKRTQVMWGISDFEGRFQRLPEGMWLPETAVNLESLEVLADHGIKYTILSPYQAKRTLSLGSDQWSTTKGGLVDTTQPYTCRLPSGKSIALFFYNGPVSRALAFENLLKSGADFADRLVNCFSIKPDYPQLVHIATDGESYGHHHRFGEMALAFALSYIEKNNLARITNYGEFLELNPPTREVEVIENTSWSCAHGIERWRANCGCNTGTKPLWNQHWRKALRESLDHLRGVIDPLFEKIGQELFNDPWLARDEYIEVIADRSVRNVKAFLLRHSKTGTDLPNSAFVKSFVKPDAFSFSQNSLKLKLLEMQRHAMLMMTSCGWFFDEISEVQTIQVIQYAGRVIQLAEQIFNVTIEEPFLNLLEAAKSNIPEYGDGREIYVKYARGRKIELEEVAAHYIIASLLEDYPEKVDVYCYQVQRMQNGALRSGRTKLSTGRIKLRSRITHVEREIRCIALHLGDHNITGGLSTGLKTGDLSDAATEAKSAFQSGDLAQVIRIIDQYFGDKTFTFSSLFLDKQREFLQLILSEAIQDADQTYQQVYELNAPVMRYLAANEIPIPDGLKIAAERALKTELLLALEKRVIDIESILQILEETRKIKTSLSSDHLQFVVQQRLHSLADSLNSDPHDIELLRTTGELIDLLPALPYEVNLWKLQNVYYQLKTTLLPVIRRDAVRGDPTLQTWMELFVELGGKLNVGVG